MTVDEWFVRTESACDRTEIEKLQAEAFGPGRFARTAFRIREGVACSPTLSLVAFRNDQLAGSIRLSPILIGSSPAMLLGPLTVAPAFKNQGLGKLLLRTTLEQAQAEGESAVLLVGDAGYYAPCGFQLVPHGTIRLPGPVDPARLLIVLFGGVDMPVGSVRAGR